MDHRPCSNLMAAKKLVYEFFTRLLEHERFRNASIVVMCERNSGTFAGSVDEVLYGTQRVHMIHEDVTRLPGVVTTEAVKDQYGKDLRMELERNALYYDTDLLTTIPDRDGIGQIPTAQDITIAGGHQIHIQEAEERQRRAVNSHIEDLKEELLSQMRRCRPRAPTVRTDTPKHVGWSAKCDVDGKVVAGMNDDLLVMLAAGAHWSMRWEQQTVPNVPREWYTTGFLGYSAVGPTHGEGAGGDASDRQSMEVTRQRAVMAGNSYSRVATYGNSADVRLAPRL